MRAGGTGGGDEGRHGEDHLDIAAGHDHHRAQPQHAGHHVQRGHRLLLVHAHVDELVVGVAAVRLHGILPLEDAAGEGGDGVEDGKPRMIKGTMKEIMA